jgi:nucleotide-binding universal stress UspA family protein
MYRKILVPIDGSATSKRGLREAIRLVKSQGGQLRLFHMASERIVDCGYAVGTYGGELMAPAREDGANILSEAESIVRREGLVPEVVLAESAGGPASASIVKQAKEWPADLIVMGTHGRRGVARMALGSDAECVVRAAPVPVLLIRDIVLEDHPSPEEGRSSNPSAQVVYA